MPLSQQPFQIPQRQATSDQTIFAASVHPSLRPFTPSPARKSASFVVFTKAHVASGQLRGPTIPAGDSGQLQQYFPTFPASRNYARATCPFFTKIPKYFFNTSNGTQTITVSILFRRLKNTVFDPPGTGNTPNSHKLEAHSKSPFSSFQPRPAWCGKRTAVFFTGGPSGVVCVCRRKSGKVALQRARFRAGACTDRLLSPCHHPRVSSLLPRICLVGRTMAPSQLPAAPTHKRKRLGRRLYLAKSTTAHPQCTIPYAVHSATAFLWLWRCASRANSGALEVSTGPLPNMKPRGSLAATVLTKGE